MRRSATILALLGSVIWGWAIFTDLRSHVPWAPLLWFAIALTVAALSVWPIRPLAGFALGLATAQTLVFVAFALMAGWPTDVAAWIELLSALLVLAAAIISTVAVNRMANWGSA